MRRKKTVILLTTIYRVTIDHYDHYDHYLPTLLTTGLRFGQFYFTQLAISNVIILLTDSNKQSKLSTRVYGTCLYYYKPIDSVIKRSSSLLLL